MYRLLRILILMLLVVSAMILIFGCSNGGALLRSANHVIEKQNKSPPDPNTVAEIREVLERLCFICKDAGYREGIKECNEFERNKP